jgi:glycosyltransferase involved in cell wall biosynthesis
MKADQRFHFTEPISVVLPVCNEIGAIEAVCKNWTQVLSNLPSGSTIEFEDGNSRDGTYAFLSEIAKKDSRFILKQSIKRDGFSAAIGRLLNNAKNDWVFVADSDGQYHASDILNFLYKWNPSVQFIKGIKINRQDGFFRRFFSFIMNRFIVTFLGLPFLDYNSSHYLIHKNVVKEISKNGWTFKNSINVEIALRTILSNFTYETVYIKHSTRAEGFSRGNPPIKFLVYGLGTIKDILSLKNQF